MTGIQVPEAVVWSEGMLLSPQHLQQNDIYWQARIRHALESVQPYYWGVIELKISRSDLRAGKLTVERLHCVMPDGLAVEFPREGDAALTLDLAACKWEDAKPLRLHFAVPLRLPGAASRKSPIQRYDAVSGSVEVDENTGEGQVEVSRLRPRIELISGDVVAPKYCSIPLLEVRRSPSGSFLPTAFHPPMLRAAASAFLEEDGLHDWLAQLVRKIREKAQELAAEVSANARSVDAQPGSESARLLEGLRRLTMSLPPLEVLVRTHRAHPFDLYVALAQLVGHVASIGSDPVPLNMEEYRHDDCMPGFRAALEYVETRLEALKLAYESLPFDQVGDSRFSRTVPADLPTGTLVVELKPRPGQGIGEMTQWLQQSRIAGEDLMRYLKERRLPGATIEPVRRDSVPGLTAWPGRALFAIRNQTIEIDKQVMPVIQGGHKLVIEGPMNSLVPAAIVLYRAKQSRAAAPKERQPAHA